MWIITNKFFSTHRQLALIPVACLFPSHINLWIQYFVMCLCVNWANARKDALFDHLLLLLLFLYDWAYQQFESLTDLCAVKLYRIETKMCIWRCEATKKITRNGNSNVQWKKEKRLKQKKKQKLRQQKEKKMNKCTIRIDMPLQIISIEQIYIEQIFSRFVFIILFICSILPVLCFSLRFQMNSVKNLIEINGMQTIIRKWVSVNVQRTPFICMQSNYIDFRYFFVFFLFFNFVDIASRCAVYTHSWELATKKYKNNQVVCSNRFLS